MLTIPGGGPGTSRVDSSQELAHLNLQVSVRVQQSQAADCEYGHPDGWACDFLQAGGSTAAPSMLWEVVQMALAAAPRASSHGQQMQEARAAEASLVAWRRSPELLLGHPVGALSLTLTQTLQ